MSKQDVIELLTEDHREVEEMFVELEAVMDGAARTPSAVGTWSTG